MTSRLYYPTQQPPLPAGAKIIADDSYFLLRLHDSQVVVNTRGWGEAGTVLLKTSIKSDIHDQFVTGLHKVESVRKRTATRLAAQIELTDWLPAYGGDALQLELHYILVKNDPLKQLLDKIAAVGLSTKLTAIKWEVGIGVKVTEMLGRAFSYLLEEGQAEEVFRLQADLNVDKLQPGFIVAADTHYPGTIPTQFIITEREDLVLKNQFGHPLDETTYAVLEMLPRKRLNERYWRESTWGEVLLAGFNEARRTRRKREEDKIKALEEFVEVCYYASKVAATDRRFIRNHVDEIMGMLEQELESEFFGQESAALKSPQPLPKNWQRAFNFQTDVQLQAAVEHYQEALADSETWLLHYGIVEE